MVIICPHCKAVVRPHANAQDANDYILSCPNCGSKCFAQDRGYKDEKNEPCLYVVFPVATPVDDPLIPEEVKKDYYESALCHNIGASRATAAMCRRAIQSSAIQKGASKSKLVDQIDELVQKQIISPQLAEWAHEIRLWGNIGAHPDEDGLEDVSPEDASEIFNFTTEYLEHVYIMPSRIAAKKVKRESMKNQ